MSQSVCPVCNLKIGDYESACPGCGSKITPKKDIEAEIHTVFSHSEYSKLIKSSKTNIEILSSLTPEQKRTVAAYKDLKGKYPWEADRESSNEVPTTKIVLPKENKKQTQKSSTPKKQTTSTTTQTRQSTQTAGPRTTQPPSNQTTKTVPAPATTAVKDKRSIILNLIVLFCPLVGVFYYFSAKKSKPKKAKSALRAALFAMAFNFVTALLIELGFVTEDIYTFIYNNSLNLFN